MIQSTQDTGVNSQSSQTAGENLNETHTEPDINLIDLLIALGQEKMTLVLVTALAAITGVIVSLVTPATYVARASIMPSQQSSGGGGLASLGGLAGLAGMGGLGGISNLASGLKSSDELYIALMRSQSVQTSLIDLLKLRDRYGAKNIEEARLFLSEKVAILADKKSGLILIDAQDKDAEFAAQLANAQVKELNVILSRLAVTEAQQRRAYYEQQIVKTQVKIPELEMQFKEAQKSSGVEVASLLSEAGSLPGQIAAKELQLQVLSRFATAQNPELKRLAGEISALRTQLARYELSKSESKSRDQGGAGDTTGQSRSDAVQKATQAYNTLKIQEALLDGFVKQLEVAKVDEAKEGPTVQVVDEARAPEIRAKPERRKLVLAFTVTGFCIGLLLAALKALMRHLQSTPEGQAQWLKLKKAWGLR